MRNRFLTTEPKRIETFRGVTIHADEGLHAQMMRFVEAHLPPGSSVVDLGAGAGAFSARLIAHGYRVTPVDVDDEKWQVPDLQLVKLDLNRPLDDALASAFDGVCALEVIEHVENPWQLFRDAWALLRPEGLLFLSTPNVASFLSRLRFLRRGRFHQFDDVDLAYGHINPMTPFEIEMIAAQTGWTVVDRRPGGYLPVFDFSQRNARSLAVNLFRGLAYVAGRGPKAGWCITYVLKKSS